MTFSAAGFTMEPSAVQRRVQLQSAGFVTKSIILNCAPSPAFVFLAAACCLEWCDRLGALSCAHRLAKKGTLTWQGLDSRAPRPPEHLCG